MPSLVTSVLGGIKGASASTNAAKAIKEGYINAGVTQADAKNEANTTLQTNADQAAADARTSAANAAAGVTAAAGSANTRLDPYATTGAAATKTLGDIYAPGGAGMKNFSNADMQDDDGYAFRLQQGQQALDRSASVHGTLGGGSYIKGLTDYAQGAASQEYQSAFDRYQKQKQDRFANLDALSREGQTAATTQGGNDVSAAKYGGDTDIATAEYAGNMHNDAAARQSGNDMVTGQLEAGDQLGYAGADANGILGRQASYNGMLSGIGTSLNSAITGGFGGGGGFSLGGALSGVPSRGGSVGGRSIGTNWDDVARMYGG